MTDRLERVILKRKDALSYLGRTHEGSVHWMNLAKLTKKQINAYDKKNTKLRSQHWFLLGMSIGRLLEQPNGEILLQAIMLMIEEYEHFKYYPLRNGKYPSFKWYPPSSAEFQNERDIKSSKTALHRVGKRVIYQQFLAYSINVPLSYCEVVFSLCEVLSLVYNKLLAQSALSKTSHEKILKFDSWVKTNLISAMVKHLSDVAEAVISITFDKLTDNITLPYKRALEEAEKKAKLEAEEEEKKRKAVAAEKEAAKKAKLEAEAEEKKRKAVTAEKEAAKKDTVKAEKKIQKKSTDGNSMAANKTSGGENKTNRTNAKEKPAKESTKSLEKETPAAGATKDVATKPVEKGTPASDTNKDEPVNPVNKVTPAADPKTDVTENDSQKASHKSQLV